MESRTNAIDMTGAVTMRAPRAWMQFYIPADAGKGANYTSDQHGLIRNVATIHVGGLQAWGCVVVEAGGRDAAGSAPKRKRLHLFRRRAAG